MEMLFELIKIVAITMLVAVAVNNLTSCALPRSTGKVLSCEGRTNRAIDRAEGICR